MKRSYWNWFGTFVSTSLIAGAVAATGCVDASQPALTAGSAEQTIIKDSAALSAVTVQGMAQFERTSRGDTVSLTGADWAQIAPGLWKNSTPDGTNTVAIGAEGQRSAIAQAEQALAALQLQPDAASAIEQQEAYIAQLEGAAQSFAAAADATPRPRVTCTLSWYIGASSPVTGFVGEAAIGQAACSDGCVGFTIQSQACSNFGCTPVNSASGVACPGAPFASGVAVTGTAGAACSGAVNFIPGGFVSAGTPCG